MSTVPALRATAREIVEKECGYHAKDPDLIGYFSHNELRWGVDWRRKRNMLTMYLSLPSNAPGRLNAIDFVRRKYSGQIKILNQTWGIHANGFADGPSDAGTETFSADNSECLGRVARRYSQVCANTIHAADPNHLYLSVKFAGTPPDPVICAAHSADVVSVDIYKFGPRPAVKHLYKLAERPVLESEFAFRAEASGLPNTRGAGPKVPAQAATAHSYTNYVKWLESLPEVVDYRWFEWCDEPREGRVHGENSSYGLVNVHDKPYRQFVRAVKAANQATVSTHHNLM